MSYLGGCFCLAQRVELPQEAPTCAERPQTGVRFTCKHVRGPLRSVTVVPKQRALTSPQTREHHIPITNCVGGMFWFFCSPSCEFWAHLMELRKKYKCPSHPSNRLARFLCLRSASEIQRQEFTLKVYLNPHYGHSISFNTPTNMETMLRIFGLAVLSLTSSISFLFFFPNKISPTAVLSYKILHSLCGYKKGNENHTKKPRIILSIKSIT